MYGPRCGHVNEAVDLFPIEQLLDGGLVDYVLGAEPGPGVFVLGYDEHPIKRQYMQYLKMGDGPLYCFYTPYHLPHLEPPITIARAALFGDAATAPIGAPVVDVITAAKRQLNAGETLDGIGGFTCYGVTENADTTLTGGFLPMSLAEGCRLKRDVPRDAIVRYEDVELPRERVVDRLREEQTSRFFAGRSAVA
jgi:predicted homoserine dehydrogenase-like protein